MSFATRELTGSTCDPCTTAKRNFVKREGRKQANRAEQVKAGSRARITYLTPSRRKERHNNQKKAARSLRDRLHYAKRRLESDALKAAFSLEKDGVLLDLFKLAAKHIEDNKDGARAALLEGLVAEAAKEEAGSALSTDQQDQCAALASFVVDEVQNASRRIAKKPTAVRFSPRVMRLALGLWMKSPTAYKVLEESGLIVVPSDTTLKRVKAAAAVSDGLSPEVFGWLASNFKSHSDGKGMAGHVMCDELKLRSGVAWNTATHRTVGLVGREGRVCLADDVKSLLRGELSQEGGEAPAGEESETVTYVNQWKLRSVYGRTFLLSYGVSFGLETIKRCLVRDQARRSSKTKLTASAVDPDRWEKMRVNLAKTVFDPGTVDEIIFHIGESLGILSDLVSSGCGGDEVQWRALTSRRIDTLKKTVSYTHLRAHET